MSRKLSWSVLLFGITCHEEVHVLSKYGFESMPCNIRKSVYPFYLPSADGSYRYPRYEFYARHFNQTVKALGIAPHHSHDCRKTFVTHAKEAGVDEYAIKRLVGHRIQDLTERVYTDRSIEWLRTELEKIS